MRTKKSMRIQKIVFYGFLIASFLVILASLAFVADGWVIFDANKQEVTKSLYKDMSTKIKVALMNSDEFYDKYPQFSGSNVVYSLVFTDADTAVQFYRNIWFNIQSLNNIIFYTGFISCALVAVCGITGSFTRKKFYLSNLVSGCVTGTFGILMSIIMIVKSIGINSDFIKAQPDVDLYFEATIAGGGSNIVDSFSTSNIYIGMIVGIAFLVVCGLFIAYNVFRFIQTRKQISNEEVIAND